MSVFDSKTATNLPILTDKTSIFADFKQANVSGVKSLKTSSLFKWAYEAGNQGIYS